MSVRALLVPDEAAWTMWGRDPRSLGFVPAPAPEQAEALVVPHRLPEALAAAVAEAWARVPPPRRLVAWEAGLGAAAREGGDGPERHGGHAGDGGHGGGEGHAGHAGHAGEGGEGHGGHGGHGGGDHQAMMEIRGEPSADRLVMERIDFELGPLADGLPGGLLLELSLDGDVVAACRARALLAAAPADAPDPLARAAWREAVARARGEPATAAGLAAVESERALSHAAWLRGFGRLLGWDELTALAQAAVAALIEPAQGLRAAAALGVDEPDAAGRLAAGAHALARLRSALEGSRRLAARTRGRAVVPRARLEDAAVGGPVARAAGLERDARLGDPLYAALGFRPELREAGDAEARTLVRAAEADAAVRLARAALQLPDRPAGGGDVEGPRGALRAALHDGRHLSTGEPGRADVLALAGEAVVGLELAAALAGIASFDLSPWTAAA